MNSKVAIFAVCLTSVVCRLNAKDQSIQTSCISSVFGSEYRGTENMTATGETCTRWDMVLPSSTTNWTAHENYCRYFTGVKFSTSPTGLRTQPWCYINGVPGWEYCSVPRCDLPPYKTCYSSPAVAGSAGTTPPGCNCGVSLSLKATPPIQLIKAAFLFPPEGGSCSRDVVLTIDDGKPLELTCSSDGQSIALSMQMTSNVSYNIRLGIKVNFENLTVVGMHQIKYAAMPFVNLTKCAVVFPTVDKPSASTNVEIRTLDGNGTTPTHDHGSLFKGRKTNHTLKGLVIGLVVSTVVAAGVISVVTYIWLIDRKRMRSELLREYMGDDNLSSDEEKTYISEPKAYVNAVALESEREEQGKTLDQLDPAALARNTKNLKPDGCNCESIDSHEKRDSVNGHVTQMETAIVPISELENFDDLSDVIANPLVEDIITGGDGKQVNQENSV